MSCDSRELNDPEMVKIDSKLLEVILILFLICNGFSWCREKKIMRKRCECGVINYPSRRIHFSSENARRRKVRIVGGHEVAPPNKYPWMVSILKNGKHSCGGVIISHYYVMTAAHCVYEHNCFKTKSVDCYVKPDILSISFICPKFKCPAYPVETIHGHKSFSPNKISYDIALLKVKKKIPCNHLTAPICLPISHNLESSGIIGTIAGWGQKKSGTVIYHTEEKLQEGKMKIQNRKACGKILNKVRTHFCAFNLGQAICRGDSGGPFFVQRNGRSYVVGISSFGNTPYCTSSSKEFFTKVRPLIPWIYQKLQQGTWRYY